MQKRKYVCMVFLSILCHHYEYSYMFSHTMKIIHMGLKVYDAMINAIKIFIFFSNAMLMQKSKYAKVKIINAMQKSKYG
jgi:hypothetical protein